MPKIKYSEIYLNDKKQVIISQAQAICDEYARQGFDLTLRQVYYQFVARDLFPEEWADKETGSTNNMRSYKKLQDIINDARLAGLIDWEHITDRTRFLRTVSTWSSPRSIINSAAQSYRTDKWQDQKYRIEVWVEKDALVGVVERICWQMEVPFLSCRGYVSQSELWGSAQRMLSHLSGNKQIPVVLHLGDHDPSGLDMTRDIQSRLQLFTGRPVEVDRLALNRDQVDQYNPPPNPAKSTDARYSGYVEEHGDESWELDALDPNVIAELIRTAILERRDERKWETAVDNQERERGHITEVAAHWNQVVDWVENDGPIDEG